jgi:hypothetical protein
MQHSRRRTELDGLQPIAVLLLELLGVVRNNKIRRYAASFMSPYS